MGAFEIIVLFVVCAFFSAFLYGMWLLENDNDEFRKRHGVKPKYYRCVTKGDMYCNHSEWCDAEIILYPEEYEAEMKRKQNEQNQDQ
jgi:hypothetical protein